MLEPVRQSAINADVLFPSQIEIDAHVYRLALLRFFREMNKLGPQERFVYFFENYHSENGVSWAILKGIRYFVIAINPGTVVEDKYYGQQIVNFNLI